MIEWRLNLPYRTRDQSLGDLVCDANSLPDPEERATVLALVERALRDTNIRSAGQLIDSIEALDRDGRRRVLDEAREAAGLESATDIDAHAEFEMAQAIARRRIPSEEPPHLIAGGAIVIPPSAAELAGMQDKDDLIVEQTRQRHEQRVHEGTERAAAKSTVDQRWKPIGPGWTS